MKEDDSKWVVQMAAVTATTAWSCALMNQECTLLLSMHSADWSNLVWKGRSIVRFTTIATVNGVTVKSVINYSMNPNKSYSIKDYPNSPLILESASNNHQFYSYC